MSSQQTAKQYPTKKPSKNGQVRSVEDHFVSFHPTKAEKEAIRASETELDSVPHIIATCIERGLDLKFTTTRTSDAFCVVVRPTRAPYGTCTTLACFHSSVFTLIAMVQYMLSTKWPNYPEQQPTIEQHEFDW